MGFEWSKEQKEVITARDCDILVSAAAGSGKTAVLAERIIQRILDDKEPIDVDQLLVVTFTKAAAAEMRERIAGKIEDACEKQPDNLHLRRQSALVHNAMITTIDSFCLFVVRNHFEEIGLDPNFRIADTGEIKLLEQDTLEEVFEQFYEKADPQFLELIDRYGGKRGDGNVRDMVMKIYHQSLSSPWPLEWIAALRKPYQAKTREELMQSTFVLDIADTTGKLLQDMMEQVRRLTEICREPDGPAVYLTNMESDLALLEGAAELDEYESLRKYLSELSFDRLASSRGYQGDKLKLETVKNGRAEIKKEVENLCKKYFQLPVEELLEQTARLEPVIDTLVQLASEFKRACDKAKRKRRIVDFSDVEHFALDILVDEETKKSRETAEEFRTHFAEIMIDEYQDSNQVQEEIMRAISREEDGQYNMFMVGDVKQSIYRFRLARPELFMEKYRTFTTEGAHRRIDLAMNFRSRREVLEFCNDIFYKIMAEDLGKVAYTEEVALHHGAVGELPNEKMKPELLLFDEEDPLLKGEDRCRIEAGMTARRIRELMKDTQVTDKESGELRPLRYSDIVILLRGLGDWGRNFTEILTEQNIPAYMESQTGYFTAVEVQTVLNMLRILDNPYQDIPMAGVLASPMVGLDNEELAQIRVETEGTFAEAALHAMQQEEAPEALRRFYELYRKLRAQNDLSIHELIIKLLEESGYANYVSCLPGGERRRANLSMLVEKAMDYEKTSYRGLFHFIRYMDQLQKYDVDFGEADSIGENADVVHIMTIHKSKGLEFPVVFVSGLGRQFNQMDLNERLVLHPDLGIGIHEIQGRPKQKRNTLYRSEIIERLRRENLGEELRVLYVALTRAKEKLILTGNVKNWADTLAGMTGNVKGTLSYRTRAGAKCYLDWILPAMMSSSYDMEVCDPAKLVMAETDRQVQEQLSYEELLLRIKAVDPKKIEQINSRLDYEYPYAQQMGRKSKYSVSEFKHASMLRKFDLEENEGEKPEFLRQEYEPYIPDFVRSAEEAKEGEKKEGTVMVNRGALRGTAVHRFMECMDFERLRMIDTQNPEEVCTYVQQELERMLRAGLLEEELYSLILPEMLESFLSSETARRMAAAAARQELYREKPFVMQHEDVLVQGIIDVFWIEGDEIVVLDYKTDRVSEPEELILRYQTQLELYAEALERVFSTEQRKMKTKECLIYSFRLKEVVAV